MLETRVSNEERWEPVGPPLGHIISSVVVLSVMYSTAKNQDIFQAA